MRKCLKLLHQIQEIFCTYGLLFVTATLFLNVVLRYVFRSGLHWSDEVIRYVMIWISFIGITFGIRQDKLMAVDLILNYVGPGLERFIRLVNNILGLLFSVLILCYGKMAVSAMARSTQVSPALEAPMYIFYLVIPLSGALMTLEFIFACARTITGKGLEKSGLEERGEA